MRKLISMLSVVALLFGVIAAYNLTHASNYTSGTEVTYTGKGISSYTITVPAQIEPGGSGTVYLSGTWDSNTTINVTADSKVTITNSINRFESKKLDINFDGIHQIGSNIEQLQTSAQISVDDTSAFFGVWSGTFYYNVGATQNHSFDNNGVCTKCGIINYTLTADDYELKTGVNITSGNIVIPETFSDTEGNQYLVTAIGDSAFANCTGLTSVSIPDTVTSIGAGAFFTCENIVSINIPEGVNKLGALSFANLRSITELEIPDSVTVLEYGAILGCYNLESIELPQNLVSVGECALFGCDKITTVHIPESVNSIGNQAFTSCDMLDTITVDADNSNYCSVDGVLYNKNITTLIAYPEASSRSEFTVPNTVTTIGMRAFYTCKNIERIELPVGLTTIGSDAFFGCSSIDKVILPDTVQTIGNYAFGNCTGMTYIKLPSSLKTIDDYAFCDCWTLNNVVLPQSLTYLGSFAFSDCRELTSINIPEGITKISNHAFAFCSELVSVGLHDNVTSIGDSAFSCATKLYSISIPVSVKSIGDQAFDQCNDLNILNYEGTTADWGNITLGYDWYGIYTEYVQCTDGVINLD